jgi:flagellar motility protein MotE (MotC chaperone)
MSFSCPNKTALTDTDLNATFGNGIVQGLLPSSPNGASDRDGSGMLNKNAVQAIVSSLKGSGVIPSPAAKPELYTKKQGELLKNVQDEYCFYETRYKYSLEQLFNAIRQGYTNNTGDAQAAVQKYLQSTQALNQRLNDLTQIINGVTDDMLSSSSNLESEIRSFDTQIRAQKEKLMAQNKVISSNQATMELNKQMVKFTEQKAKYSDNLLSLYAVMNVVAFGLLVYVYKSSD